MSHLHPKSIRKKTTIPGPESKRLVERRQQHIPRGPFHTSPAIIKKANGALVTDIDGNQYIDLAGAIGSLNVGHCPPQVVKALKQQLDHFIHPSFHVFMYESYIKLAERLNEITPGTHKKKTFFLNSGAEAVENAVKIARKFTGRRAIASFERGFHGRTLLTMSLTSKVAPYKSGFGPFAPDTYKLPFPDYYRKPEGMSDQAYDEHLLAEVERFFLSEVPPEEIAAFIMEPIQGEGGFIVPSKYFVQSIKQICEQHDILFIADEIQTGFGRTGFLFACEYFSITPDIMTMSKSLAAGLPLSAVTGRAEIMDSPNVGEIGGTYGGSPLGCVAAIEVIKIIEEQHLNERAKEIGKKITTRFKQMQNKYPFIGDVRGLGAMCAIEMVTDRTSKTPNRELTAKIVQRCNERGVVILSAGLYSNVVRILCPLVITDAQLDEALTIIDEVMASML